MADERLSNVVGAPFSEHVLTQLDIRTFHNSTGKGSFPNRTNTDVLFLANKSAWVRLTSSVRLVANGNKTVKQFYDYLNLSGNYSNNDDLAKNWILEAGTSISNGAGINIRKGIGLDGAYGLGGTEELGYRPMPGLTSVIIDTKGTLGSLREAIVNFKVWNIDQLNIIEALYFRLGYSMLLEWGHNQFYSNVGNFFGTFVTNPTGIDAFQKERKELVQQRIAKLGRQYSGNYDGMLGIVSNFTWSFNQEGGYDCVVKLIGLGAILDSLRINLSFKMPDVVFEEYRSQNKTIQQRQQEIDAKNKKLQEERNRSQAGLPPLPAVPQNAQQIYTNVYTNDAGTGNPLLTEQQFLTDNSVYSSYTTGEEDLNFTPDYFYKAGLNKNSIFVNELNQKVTGLFLNKNSLRAEWSLVNAGISFSEYQPVSIRSAKLNQNLVWYYNSGLESISNFQEENAISSFTQEINLGANKYINENLGVGLGVGNIFYPIRNTDFLQNSKYKSNLAKFVDVSIRAFESPNQIQSEELIIGKVYYAKVKNTELQKKPFYFFIKFYPNPSVNYTKAELVKALDDWSNQAESTVNLTFVEAYDYLVQNLIRQDATFRDVLIKGDLSNISIPNKPTPRFEVIFNNSAYIDKVLPKPLKVETQLPNQAQTPNTGDNSGTINTADSTQIDPSAKFASALHAMLAAVKSQMLSKSDTLKPDEVAYSDSIELLTSRLYQNTIFDNIISTTDESTVNPNGVPFDLKRYALKGFNSNLMSDPLLYDKIPPVDYQALCQAFGIRYLMDNEAESLNYPIYIKFGYLLAFINSMCLIYDSTQDTDKHPYVYIDFNPATNFCLTNPQHLSVDPYVCMIPYQGSREQYLKIFPDSIVEKFSKQTSNVFGSTELNRLSSFLNSFKNPKNEYQGNTMEILLNVDFLIRVLNQNTTTNPEHSINLKGFLDSIVREVNKVTGNINLFRVAYRDDTNTVIIKDDQFVPPSEGEAYMLYKQTYVEQGRKGQPKYGMIPVFGAQSLVREMEFKTNLTTNISNQIAISAQAFTGSANSKDYSPFSYLNISSVSFEDAFKPRVSDSANTVTIPTAVVTGSDSNDLAQAQQFNQHILSLYYGGEYVSRQRIDMATNYYIEGMAKIKSTDQVTVAAPFIPANLSITIDGISGIVMGNAFTIPENRLPLSLRGNDDQTKVGFIVVGLTHTIDQNQWLTKIRGQMIRLRDKVSYSGITFNEKLQQLTLPQVRTTAGTIDTPWSAAFISFVMQRAEVQFPANATHTGYAQSLRVNSLGFSVLNPRTTVIQRGDIVIKNRNGNSLSFLSTTWTGESHGDIVVEINGNTAVGISGNLSNTVRRSNITLVDGRLAERDYFVVLRPPKSSVTTIVNVASVEYKLWSSNNWTESTQAAFNTLAAYYKTVGIII